MLFVGIHLRAQFLWEHRSKGESLRFVTNGVFTEFLLGDGMLPIGVTQGLLLWSK